MFVKRDLQPLQAAVDIVGPATPMQPGGPDHKSGRDGQSGPQLRCEPPRCARMRKINGYATVVVQELRVDTENVRFLGRNITPRAGQDVLGAAAGRLQRRIWAERENVLRDVLASVPYDPAADSRMVRQHGDPDFGWSGSRIF